MQGIHYPGALPQYGGNGVHVFLRSNRGAGFTPGSIAGLKLWLAADAIEGLSDDDPVATWADASGEGNDATQAAAGLTPTYQESELNDLPVVRFDGSDWLGFPALFLDDFSMFFVVKQAGDNGLLGRQADSAPQIRIGQGANKLSTFDGSNNPLSDALGVAQGQWSLVEFVRSGTTISFFQNGTAYGTGTMVNSGDIGRKFDQLCAIVSVIPLNGDMAEVAVYNVALSTENREAFEGYAMTKYGL